MALQLCECDKWYTICIGYDSEINKMKCGVPQGSILGPDKARLFIFLSLINHKICFLSDIVTANC